MWWMKPVSSHLVAQKKMKVGGPSSQDILLQRQLSTPGRTAVAFFQGLADLPSPRTPLPRSLIVGHFVPPLPRSTPLANHHTPNMPGGPLPAGTQPAVSVHHRQLYRSSTLKSGNRAIKKTGDILTSASDKLDDDSTQPNKPPQQANDRTTAQRLPRPKRAVRATRARIRLPAQQNSREGQRRPLASPASRPRVPGLWRPPSLSPTTTTTTTTNT